MLLTTDTEAGGPRVARRSPFNPAPKLCPKCLKPLQRGSKLGGWLIPQDYYCASCGYKGTAYLEKSSRIEDGS